MKPIKLSHATTIVDVLYGCGNHKASLDRTHYFMFVTGAIYNLYWITVDNEHKNGFECYCEINEIWYVEINLNDYQSTNNLRRTIVNQYNISQIDADDDYPLLENPIQD